MAKAFNNRDGQSSNKKMDIQTMTKNGMNENPTQHSAYESSFTPDVGASIKARVHALHNETISKYNVASTQMPC